MARWGCERDVIIRVMAIFGSWSHLGSSRGHLGAILGRSWAHLGAILEPLGPRLGWKSSENAREILQTWDFAGLEPLLEGHLSHLGPLGLHLGPSWGDVGPSKGHLGLSWGILGPSWAYLGAIFPIFRLKNAVKYNGF